MTDDPNKPLSPWTMTPARIVMLILGALVLVYLISALMGGLGNYQMLKEAADAVNQEQPARQ